MWQFSLMEKVEILLWICAKTSFISILIQQMSRSILTLDDIHHEQLPFSSSCTNQITNYVCPTCFKDHLFVTIHMLLFQSWLFIQRISKTVKILHIMAMNSLSQRILSSLYEIILVKLGF